MDTKEKITALLEEIESRKTGMTEEELLKQLEEVKKMQIYMDITSLKNEDKKKSN